MTVKLAVRKKAIEEKCVAGYKLQVAGLRIYYPCISVKIRVQLSFPLVLGAFCPESALSGFTVSVFFFVFNICDSLCPPDQSFGQVNLWLNNSFYL